LTNFAQFANLAHLTNLTNFAQFANLAHLTKDIFCVLQ
jgi:hypothetical protein